ncbi:MAG: type II toxin-antitoxin system VapC family toxin [Solirubrobacteraceae bacterium]
MISYVDTSAAMKLLVEEPQTAPLVAYLQSPVEGERRLIASWLLHTELHCAANRHPDAIDAESVGIVLDTVSLIDLTRGDLLTAGMLPGGLRSPDAVHLAVALRAGAGEIVCYDTELIAAAESAGLAVIAPG